MSYFCVICWTSIISKETDDTSKNPSALGGTEVEEETNASLYVKSSKHQTNFQSFLAVFKIEDPRIWVKKPSKFCSECEHPLTRVYNLKEELKQVERLIKGEEQLLIGRLKLRTRTRKTVAINSKNEDVKGNEDDKNWWEELPDSPSHPGLECGDDGWNSKETNDGVPVDPVVAHDEDEKEKIEEKILSPAVALTVPIEEESGYDSGPAFPSTSKTIIPCQILKRRLPPEIPESRESSSLGSQDEFNESLPKRAKRGEAREEGESSSSSLNLLNSPQNPILLTETSSLRQIALQVASNYEAERPMEFISNLEQDQINFDNKDQDERSKLSKGKTISIINTLNERDIAASQFFFNNSLIEQEIIDGNKEPQQVSSQDEREAAEILLNLGNFTPKNEPNKETNGPPLTTPKLGDEDLFSASNIEGNERKGGAQKSLNNSTKKVAKKKLKKIMKPSPSSGIEEPKECPTCSKKFRTPNLLRIHLNAAHKLGNLHRCPICNRPYYGKKAPRRHIWTHYSAQEKEEAVAKGEKVPSCWEKGFMCDQCPSAFTTNSELLKHQKQIHEEVVERQACEKCGSLVKNLAGHMRQSHPKKEDFRFVCLECEEKFINSARLRQHKLSKHGEGKKVKCERCEELFKTRRELTVHVNSKHLKIMPYKCEFCGMAFTRKMSWTRHVQGVHKEKKGGQTKKRNNMALNRESRNIS